MDEVDKQKIDDVLKNVRSTSFDVQGRVEHLKNLCVTNKIEVEHLQDSVDQLLYGLYYITESMEKILLDRKKEAEEKLKSSKSTLKTLSKAYNVLRNTNVSYTCPICITNSVEVYLDCGHTMCSQCSSKTNHCFFCRCRINRVMKLFFML